MRDLNVAYFYRYKFLLFLNEILFGEKKGIAK
ncbi:hypothetical protein J939_4041, partial [Acinetobacter baumannii 44362_6]